jgi:hypothetical protein
VVQEGSATFTAGGDVIEATGGQVVVVPAGVAHDELHYRKIEEARLDDDLRASAGEPFLAIPRIVTSDPRGGCI